jgi:protoporphyrinogen IX oxidase
MLWLKTFHIFFVVSWFAGLFYLPRLFVYHAMTEDTATRERFKVMERKLYRGIMTPTGVLTLITGIWLWQAYDFKGGWLHAKLALVVLLVIYHVHCGVVIQVFKEDRNTRSHVWYRWYNEAPTVVLLAIIALVVVKPF